MVRRLDLVLSNGAGSASKLIWQAGLAQGMPALAAFPTIATGMFKAPSLSPDIWDQRLLLGSELKHFITVGREEGIL